MSTTPLLELDQVTVRYGSTPALSGVDLSVGAGQVVALLGPNGAGKTTVLRTAAGLQPVAAGKVRLEGVEVTSWRAQRLARAGLCLIPEGRGVFPNLTVRENFRLHRSSGDSLARILDVFPALEKWLDSVAGRLSGGQQQMVALARALVTEPKVVMLDEVSMGLAPLVTDEMFAALERLAAEGVSLVIVEQYVDKALALADKVYVLDRGRISWWGAPSETSHEELMERYLGTGASA
ncbi:MAG: ABC transporter ATP-binding protein [Acidimicrobiaceae bacterium]|nr:ABC transporter ATP-binding protein [Acidimicrobiaceae bacterium]